MSSVILSNSYNINETIELSFQRYKNEIVNGGSHFSTEVFETTRRFNLCNNKSYQNKQKVDITQTRVDGERAYIVESRPNFCLYFKRC